MVAELSSRSALEIRKDQKDSGFRFQALHPESTRQICFHLKKGLCFKKGGGAGAGGGGGRQGVGRD